MAENLLNIRCRYTQRLWMKSFQAVEELRVALTAWAELYSREWLTERHGFTPPAQARLAYYDRYEKLEA
jgi:hypothetical protein